MKTKNMFFISFVIFSLFLVGCGKKVNDDGIWDSQQDAGKNDGVIAPAEDKGIDDVFDDDKKFKPPSIPI